MGGLRIVVLGGGSGLSILLRGLVREPDVEALTAIVATTDDGGSTGRLREAFALPAVGDLRACLSAVCSSTWAPLLEHRFDNGTMRGHALGNLLLVAAHEQDRLLSAAVARVSKMVRAKVRLLPATDANATLWLRLTDGRELHGQSVLATVTGCVERVELRPAICAPAPGVLDAIADADLIVLGPGSLFTSVVASALAAGVAPALVKARAPKLLVQNLATQRGETDELSVVEHLHAVRAQLGFGAVDALLVHQWNGVPPPQGLVADPKVLSDVELRLARVATEAGRGLLHDPALLAREVVRFGLERRLGQRTG